MASVEEGVKEAERGKRTDRCEGGWGKEKSRGKTMNHMNHMNGSG